MTKVIVLFFLLAIFSVNLAYADQASCNADAKSSLEICLKSTKDSSVKSACLSTFYIEVAKCAYIQNEENKQSRSGE